MTLYLWWVIYNGIIWVHDLRTKSSEMFGNKCKRPEVCNANKKMYACIYTFIYVYMHLYIYNIYKYSKEKNWPM